MTNIDFKCDENLKIRIDPIICDFLLQFSIVFDGYHYSLNVVAFHGEIFMFVFE